MDNAVKIEQHQAEKVISDYSLYEDRDALTQLFPLGISTNTSVIPVYCNGIWKDSVGTNVIFKDLDENYYIRKNLTHLVK